jgi:transcriptional regulator with XRE-family HTH domain
MEKVDTISNRIVEAMRIRNMKQADIIQATGIGKSSLSQYISNKCEPKTDKIFLIANALDVSEVWLMGFDVEMDREDWTSPYYINIKDIATVLSDGSLQLKQEAIEFLHNFDKETVNVIFDYVALNEKGQKRLQEYLKELLSIKKYSDKKEGGE